MSAASSAAYPVGDSIAEILLSAARDLERAEIALRGGVSPRLLHVVEFKAPDGTWHPMAGDAYLDEGEAERCSGRSELETRVVPYGPRSGL